MKSIKLQIFLISIFLIMASGFCCQLLGQEKQDSMMQNGIKLKDDTFVKGVIIEETDTFVKLVTPQNDTLTYSYKHISKTYDFGSLKYDLNARKRITPVIKHKSDGYFVNLNIFLRPLGVEFGKRINSRLNLGLHGSFLVFRESRSTSSNRLLAIGPYGKYFLSDINKQNRFYVEGFGGVAFGNVVENTNKFKPFGGVSLGFQFPLINSIEMFLDMGVDLRYSKTETRLNNNATEEIHRISRGILLTALGFTF